MVTRRTWLADIGMLMHRVCAHAQVRPAPWFSPWLSPSPAPPPYGVCAHAQSVFAPAPAPMHAAADPYPDVDVPTFSFEQFLVFLCVYAQVRGPTD